MEDLIGFVIFLAIAVLSIISKMRSDKKSAEEPREERKGGLENLPETTRRMLFGDGEIIVAKPRRVEPPEPSAQPKAMPMQPHQERPAHRETRPVRPTPVQPAFPRPAPAPKRAAPPPPPRRPAAPARKVAARSPAPREPEEGAYRPKPSAVSPQPAARPLPAGRTAPGFLSLCSRHELARAILLREVLGPPRALEDLPML